MNDRTPGNVTKLHLVRVLHRVHQGFLVHLVPGGWTGPLVSPVLRVWVVPKVQRVSRDRR